MTPEASTRSGGSRIGNVRVRPDISVSARANSCCKITVKVSYSPGIPPGTAALVAVPVRITDEVAGGPDLVCNVEIPFPAAGGLATFALEVPRPEPLLSPDWFNDFTVTVDPNNQIPERNERNNSITVRGFCH